MNGHDPEPERTLKNARSQTDTIPNGHNPEWKRSRMDMVSNEHDPEWTRLRTGTIPKGHDSEWTQSRKSTYIVTEVL